MTAIGQQKRCWLVLLASLLAYTAVSASTVDAKAVLQRTVLPKGYKVSDAAAARLQRRAAKKTTMGPDDWIDDVEDGSSTAAPVSPSSTSKAPAGPITSPPMAAPTSAPPTSVINIPEPTAAPNSSSSVIAPAVSTVLDPPVSDVQEDTETPTSVTLPPAVVVVTAINDKATPTGQSSSLDSEAAVQTLDSSSSSGSTWAIVGGVVGGICLLGGLIFVICRLTQRRFSGVDDLGDEIKWPELNPDFTATSTLNPSNTRRTGGAGIEMGERGEGTGSGNAGGRTDQGVMEYERGYESNGYDGEQQMTGGNYFDPAPSIHSMYNHSPTQMGRYKDSPHTSPLLNETERNRSQR